MNKIKKFIFNWLEVNNGSKKAFFVRYILKVSYKIFRSLIKTLRKPLMLIKNQKKVKHNFFLPSVLTKKEISKINESFRILFCGDLILLEDQVKRAWNGKEYIFDEMFEYTRKYIHSADLSIGVFEGPLGGGYNGILNKQLRRR